MGRSAEVRRAPQDLLDGHGIAEHGNDLVAEDPRQGVHVIGVGRIGERHHESLAVDSVADGPVVGPDSARHQAWTAAGSGGSLARSATGSWEIWDSTPRVTSGDGHGASDHEGRERGAPGARFVEQRA